MSGNIENVNGKASIILQGKPGWHGLGNVLQGKMTWSDIKAEGFFDFTVSVRPLFSGLPDGTFDPVTFGIFRDDNNHFFSACEKGYTPVQPDEIGQVLDNIMYSLPESSTYDCAGVLGKGERIFATIRVPDLDFNLATGDNYEHYVCFMSSFDRSISNTLFEVRLRVVCQNTLNQGLRTGNNFVKIKHTKNGKQKLDRVSAVFSEMVENNNDFKDRMEFLAGKELNKDVYTKIMDRIFPVKAKEEKDEKQRENSRRENTIQEITRLFDTYNQSSDFPEYNMTPYNLLNAITDYTDHVRGVRKTEKRQDMEEDILRAESSIFGSGDKLKQTALTAIYEMVGECKDKDRTVYSIYNDGPVAPIAPVDDNINNIMSMVAL